MAARAAASGSRVSRARATGVVSCCAPAVPALPVLTHAVRKASLTTPRLALPSGDLVRQGKRRSMTTRKGEEDTLAPRPGRAVILPARAPISRTSSSESPHHFGAGATRARTVREQRCVTRTRLPIALFASIPELERRRPVNRSGECLLQSGCTFSAPAARQWASCEQRG
jgi:hypothetical protein